MEDKEKETLLGWTSKQGRVLTADGKATEFYTADRGFPFQEEEDCDVALRVDVVLQKLPVIYAFIVKIKQLNLRLFLLHLPSVLNFLPFLSIRDYRKFIVKVLLLVH